MAQTFARVLSLITGDPERVDGVDENTYDLQLGPSGVATWKKSSTGGGGGLPTGWEQDDSDPANVATNGGSLIVGPADLSSTGVEIDPGEIGVFDGDGNTVVDINDNGVRSSPSNGSTCFEADDSNGATVALDASQLDVLGVRNLQVTEVDAQGVFAPGISFSGNLTNISFGEDSGAPQVGFLGRTPILRPVVPQTTPSVQDVIDALVALGLVDQSD